MHFPDAREMYLIVLQETFEYGVALETRHYEISGIAKIHAAEAVGFCRFCCREEASVEGRCGTENAVVEVEHGSIGICAPVRFYAKEML